MQRLLDSFIHGFINCLTYHYKTQKLIILEIIKDQETGPEWQTIAIFISVCHFHVSVTLLYRVCDVHATCLSRCYDIDETLLEQISNIAASF